MATGRVKGFSLSHGLQVFAGATERGCVEQSGISISSIKAVDLPGVSIAAAAAACFTVDVAAAATNAVLRELSLGAAACHYR